MICLGGGKFSQGAHIVFEGCNIGIDSTAGRKFGKAASTATGGSLIEIAKDFVSYGYSGSIYKRNYPASSIYQVAE